MSSLQSLRELGQTFNTFAFRRRVLQKGSPWTLTVFTINIKEI
jgi:hypothetical protein